MSFGQVFFFSIKFVLYLTEWASGEKNLCSALHEDWQHYTYNLVLLDWFVYLNFIQKSKKKTNNDWKTDQVAASV